MSIRKFYRVAPIRCCGFDSRMGVGHGRVLMATRQMVSLPPQLI